LNLSVENRPSCCLPQAFVNLNSRTCRPLQPLINETDTHQSVGLLQFSAHMQQTRINFLISTASLTTSSTYSAIVHSCSVQSCSFSHRTSENEYLLDNWRKFLQTMKGRWCVCVCDSGNTGPHWLLVRCDDWPAQVWWSTSKPA